MVSRKGLSIALSKLSTFTKPKRFLEQYPTDPETAGILLWEAFMRGDIEGMVVLDLGCGTGILSYGALTLGAREVLCIDIDMDALRIAYENLSVLGTECVHLVAADVAKNVVRPLSVDTVVMNPPFGVLRRGIDLLFLDVALRVARRAVYTIHKFNEESHRMIVSRAVKAGFVASLIEVRYMAIPAIYEDHRRKIHRFKVALYSFRRVHR